MRIDDLLFSVVVFGEGVKSVLMNEQLKEVARREGGRRKAKNAKEKRRDGPEL